MLKNVPTYIHTETTTHIATAGLVTVHTVVIPVNTSGTVTFQDIAGNVYFTMPSSTVAGSYLLDGVCGNGLDVVTGAADVLIVNSNQ